MQTIRTDLRLLLLAAWLATFSQASAMYNPSTGRWLSRDPIGYADGMNMYEYVKSNPLNHTDPLGLSVFLLSESSKSTLEGKLKDLIEQHERIKKDALDLSKRATTAWTFYFNGKQIQKKEEWEKLVAADVIEFEADAGKKEQDDMQRLKILADKAKHEWDFVVYGKHGLPRGNRAGVFYSDEGKVYDLEDEVLPDVRKIKTGGGKDVTTAICEFIGGVCRDQQPVVVRGGLHIDGAYDGNCKVFWKSSNVSVK